MGALHPGKWKQIIFRKLPEKKTSHCFFWVFVAQLEKFAFGKELLNIDSICDVLKPPTRRH